MNENTHMLTADPADVFATQLLSELDWKAIGAIPWVHDNAKILEVDAHFSKTKELAKEQHQLWRLLKPAMVAINNASSSPTFNAHEELKHWVAVDCAAKAGICDAIENMLFLAREYPEELANVRIPKA